MRHGECGGYWLRRAEEEKLGFGVDIGNLADLSFEEQKEQSSGFGVDYGSMPDLGFDKRKPSASSSDNGNAADFGLDWQKRNTWLRRGHWELVALGFET